MAPSEFRNMLRIPILHFHGKYGFSGIYTFNFYGAFNEIYGKDFVWDAGCLDKRAC